MARHDTHGAAKSRARLDAPDSEVDEVTEFFERYSRALIEGDALTIADCWEAPAFVVSDQGAHAVSSRDEVEKFFSGARDQYNDRGVTGTRAEITEVDWASDLIALVTVRWPLLDESGKELGDESTTYVVRRDDHGNLRLRVAINRAASVGH